MHGSRPLLALAVLAAIVVACALWYILRDTYPPEGTGRAFDAVGGPGSLSTLRETLGSPVPTGQGGDASSPEEERTMLGPSETNAWLITGRVIFQKEVRKTRRWSHFEAFPVPGATVEIKLERGWSREEIAEGTTDADGCFEVNIDKLKSFPAIARIHGRLLARAWADGFWSDDEGNVQPLPRSPKEPFTAELPPLQLQLGTVLAGRVVDARGKAVWRADIKIVAGGETKHVQRTDESGRYRFALFDEPTTVQVIASRFGYGQSRPVTIHAAETGTTPVKDLVLEDGNSIAGRAVFADGSPARDLPLILVSDKDRDEGLFDNPIETGPDVTTNKTGRFRACGLKAGCYRIKVAGANRSSKGTLARTGDRNVRLVIRDYVLVVRARDEDSKSVPGAQISVLGWRGQAARIARGHFELHGNFVDVYDTTFFRTELYFEQPNAIQALMVETDTFWALCPATDGSRESVHTVQITKDCLCHVVDVCITSSADAGRLRIQVVDSSGRPVPKFCATLRSVTTCRPLPGYDSIYPSIPNRGFRVPVGEHILQVLPMPETTNMDHAFFFNPCSWVEQRILVRPDEERLIRLQATPAAGLAIAIAPAKTRHVRWFPYQMRLTLTSMASGKRYVVRRFLSGNAILPEWNTWYVPRKDPTYLIDRTVPPGRYEVEIRAPGFKNLKRVMDLECGNIALLKGQFEQAR